MADEATPAKSPPRASTPPKSLPGSKSPPGAKSPPGSKSPTALTPASPAALDPASPPALDPASPPGLNPASPPADQDQSGPGGILPAEYWAQQEPIQYDDALVLAESLKSSTASVSSSILEYRTLHGRTYHSAVGNASYWGANDEAQSEAYDMVHQVLTMLSGDKIYLAPLDKSKIHRALDVGTGAGMWAIDFADEFPEAEVIGTDISPIQPGWIPPNLKFEIEDCTRDWTFSPSSFDYIHIRVLMGSIPDWYIFFAEAYKACRPGAWLESLEPSCNFSSDHVDLTNTAISQWGKFFFEGGKKIGRTFLVYHDGLQRKAMEAAGFVDIQESIIKVPLGSWPKDPRMKDIGILSQISIESDIEGYVLFVANTLGWTREEIMVYIAHFRNETRSGKYCPYYQVKVVCGRKPEDAE